jgi:hypothetical protein
MIISPQGWAFLDGSARRAAERYRSHHAPRGAAMEASVWHRSRRSFVSIPARNALSPAVRQPVPRPPRAVPRAEFTTIACR